MFENIANFFRKIFKAESPETSSRETAKERLHLVLMQDRANVSADFLEMMKQEIIEVIKKYIDVDENAIDVKLTNKANDDGTNGAPALYANIPIISIKEDKKDEEQPEKTEETSKEIEESSENKKDENKKPKKDTKKKAEDKEVKEETKEEKVEENNNIETTNSENKEEKSTDNSKEVKVKAKSKSKKK